MWKIYAQCCNKCTYYIKYAKREAYFFYKIKKCVVCGIEKIFFYLYNFEIIKILYEIIKI